MVWSGAHSMVYGMAWWVLYGIWYGMAGIVWPMVWPHRYGMVHDTI